uniref:dTDP-4-dehydrorhamnose reductase n=1 Tax=candidate division WOR-3 bacterium TaxID=2052148 RepID=A0A7V3NU87_UNCW3
MQIKNYSRKSIVMTKGPILILGGSGMLGHTLWEKAKDRQNVYVALRRIPPGYEWLFPLDRTILGFEATNFERVLAILEKVEPSWVINCIGIVKQSPQMQDPVFVIQVNSLFPHQLAAACSRLGARLIHLSTDCVFSGRRGQYKEEDLPDPSDFYGRSKLLGEPIEPNTLILRTSMIGLELGTRHGLLEWFLSQKGKTVRGFKRAIFSGLYTGELSRLILDLIDHEPELAGVRHLGSEAISKYDLLCLIRDECQLPIHIEQDDSVVSDRSLDSSKILKETGIRVPTWSEMARSIAMDLRKVRKE